MHYSVYDKMLKKKKDDEEEVKAPPEHQKSVTDALEKAFFKNGCGEAMQFCLNVTFG